MPGLDKELGTSKRIHSHPHLCNTPFGKNESITCTTDWTKITCNECLDKLEKDKKKRGIIERVPNKAKRSFTR